MQYVQTSYYFNCANLAVCFVCPASFFSSWMCVWVCVGVVVITFLSVAPPVSPPSSAHTSAGHQLWLLTCCSLVIRLTTEGWNKHSMIARSLCQLKYALGLCLAWVLCGGFSLAGITLLSVSTLPWSLTSLTAAVRTHMPHHCFYLEKPCQ